MRFERLSRRGTAVYLDVRAARAAMLVAITLTLGHSTTRAQDAPPEAEIRPPYAVMGSMELLLLPLIVAAEQDVAQGRPALALERAAVIYESVDPTSRLRLRAAYVRAAVGTDGSAQPAGDELLEPLVAAAALDLARGEARSRRPGSTS